VNFVVISLCDITGHMVAPWVEAGYDAVLVDPQHKPGVNVEGRVTKIGRVVDHPETYDVLRKVIRKRLAAMCFGFPPCTDLAVSGSRWFEEKHRRDWAFQFKAMQVVWQCQQIGELLGCPYMVENPVSVISSIWRKPDHSFNPADFTGYEPNDNYNKKTMLWTGGGFLMPSPKRDLSLGPPDDRIHRAPPSEDRANFRSATPMGFARAVYEANGVL
jgi:hypothetical protein